MKSPFQKMILVHPPYVVRELHIVDLSVLQVFLSLQPNFLREILKEGDQGHGTISPSKMPLRKMLHTKNPIAFLVASSCWKKNDICHYKTGSRKSRPISHTLFGFQHHSLIQ